MKIEFFEGKEAAALIADQNFQDRWVALYESCPWATVCQSLDFAGIWYEVYKDLYEPVIVTGVDESGKLMGLLPLAVFKEMGQLVFAGNEQSEYKVWVARVEEGNAFIENALEELSLRFPGQTLAFHFLPPATPLEWARAGSRWGARSELRRLGRALMSIGDGSSFNESLRAKRNKARLKGLERFGKLGFEQITTAAQLEPVFDEIMAYGALRLGAIHNLAYCHDPLKKRFYLEMMKVPRLVNATILRAGGRIASAHIDFYNKESVLFGMTVHSPFMAEHSPGRLHMLMLGRELANQRVETFDLTPGGAYKDRFATHHDEVTVLTVFFSRSVHLRHKAKRSLVETGKRAIGVLNISQDRAKEAISSARSRLRRISIAGAAAGLARRARRASWHTAELRVYSIDVEKARELPNPEMMSKDRIEDLLAYQPAEGWQLPVNLFLREAMKRLEDGHHVYTRVEEGRLVHYGWMIERQQKSYLAEVGQEFFPLPDSAVLFDYYSHPQARGKGLYRSSLCQMLHEATQIPKTERVYIAVLADNHASRHVIEKLGFKYQQSFFKKTALGKVKKWSTASEPAGLARAEKCPA